MGNRLVVYNVDIHGQNWQGVYNLCLVCLDRLTILGHCYRTNFFVTDKNVECKRCGTTN